MSGEKQPCVVICRNCNQQVYCHYAFTVGRCSNCKAQFRAEEILEQGAGI